jgi:hypothetical protein
MKKVEVVVLGLTSTCSASLIYEVWLCTLPDALIIEILGICNGPVFRGTSDTAWLVLTPG